MHHEIIEFWFTEIDQSQWWVKSDDFDELIHERFSATHSMAKQCELFEWRKEPLGRLAEIIVLDQFSRNMFRGSAESFTSDPLALALSQEAISLGADQALSASQRSFLYMPFMHSESKAIHDIAMGLYKRNGVESSLNFELKHKEIIDRFGRYPHRNNILNRESSKQELEFLKRANSGF